MSNYVIIYEDDEVAMVNYLSLLRYLHETVLFSPYRTATTFLVS